MGFVTRTDLRLVWPESGQSAPCQPKIFRSRRAWAKVRHHIARPGKVTIAITAGMRRSKRHDQDNNGQRLAFRAADFGVGIVDNGCAGGRLLFCDFTRHIRAGRLAELLLGGFFNLQQCHCIIGERTEFQPDPAGRHGNVVYPENSGTSLTPVTSPSWTGSAIGNTAMPGIAGSPILSSTGSGTSGGLCWWCGLPRCG